MTKFQQIFVISLYTATTLVEALITSHLHFSLVREGTHYLILTLASKVKATHGPWPYGPFFSPSSVDLIWRPLSYPRENAPMAPSVPHLFTSHPFKITIQVLGRFIENVPIFFIFIISFLVYHYQVSEAVN